MQTVFVHIKCGLGCSYKVAAQLVDNVEQLAGLHSISGQFDLLAQLHLEPDIDIGLFINEVVQKIPGVKDTSTTIAHNAFTPKRLPPRVTTPAAQD